MRERGRETEVGERMNGASKIGRERRGEKEDERMLERESTSRREGSQETEVERGKMDCREFVGDGEKTKEKIKPERSSGERTRARVRGRFREKIGDGNKAKR